MDESVYCEIILGIYKVLESKTIVDWHKQADTQRQIKSQLDDFLYDEVKIKMKIKLSNEAIANLLESILNLALENNELF